MHQSIPAVPRSLPPPPPRATVGHLPDLLVLGVGHLQTLLCPRDRHLPTMGYSQTFDTHVVSYQNWTMKRILLEKQAYWLFSQGQEKIEEGCKGMFSIFCMHFFIAYQARVTLRNWELSTWLSNIFQLNWIKYLLILFEEEHPFTFIKLFDITCNLIVLY